MDQAGDGELLNRAIAPGLQKSIASIVGARIIPAHHHVGGVVFGMFCGTRGFWDTPSVTLSSSLELVLADAHMDASSFPEKHYFLLRRLHSLTGLVPVGAFLCVHLMANASVLAPGEPGGEFQRAIERIHALGPLLVPVEIVFIFLPLLFHAIIGFQIIFSGKPNAAQYGYQSNTRYSIQRMSGVVAFFFIMYHVWQMHWLGEPLGGGAFRLHDDLGTPTGASSAAAAIQSAWWVAPVYALGVAACVYHLANGIWTSLITWGITIRPESQRIAGYICTAFGVLVLLIGLGALRGFKVFDVAGDSVPVSTVSAADSHGATFTADSARQTNNAIGNEDENHGE